MFILLFRLSEDYDVHSTVRPDVTAPVNSYLVEGKLRYHNTWKSYVNTKSNYQFQLPSYLLFRMDNCSSQSMCDHVPPACQSWSMNMKGYLSPLIMCATLGDHPVMPSYLKMTNHHSCIEIESHSTIATSILAIPSPHTSPRTIHSGARIAASGSPNKWPDLCLFREGRFSASSGGGESFRSSSISHTGEGGRSGDGTGTVVVGGDIAMGDVAGRFEPDTMSAFERFSCVESAAKDAAGLEAGGFVPANDGKLLLPLLVALWWKGL